VERLHQRLVSLEQELQQLRGQTEGIPGESW
jgi:hypothetical protein